MRPTKEQSEIINFKGRHLVVMAYAGSGKTATLVQYAQANPDRRMLYIAYNKAICQEAQSKFPSTVTCRTSHQLAHASIGKNYKHKFKENISLTSVMDELELTDWQIAKDTLVTLEQYLCSAEEKIVIGHTPNNDKPSSLSVPEMRYKGELVSHAMKLWEKMQNEENDFPMTHDGLLKLYQLSKPDLSIYYSAILFDEAQDANPVTTAFILSQNCITIFVGDRHQQIYRYRGADNALDSKPMEKATRMYLSNCFRFGQEIAIVANSLLVLKEETVPAIGRAKSGQVLMSIPDDNRHFAILSRTVLGTIAIAMKYANMGKRIYWVGGIQSYGIGQLADVLRLKQGKVDGIKTATIRQYQSFSEYSQRAKESGDSDMNRTVKLVSEPDIVKSLKVLSEHTVKEESEADITVSTAHRSKGLEWENVVVNEDFPDVFSLEGDVFNDEINLLYVAATRARKTLVINKTLEACMRLLLKSRK